jgi:5'-nucleotidase
MAATTQPKPGSARERSPTTAPASPRRPLVLLSNDDGYDAPGLVALRDALSKSADVTVCAPERNQSASSHSLSLHRILRLRHVEADEPAGTARGAHHPRVFAVDGTPADCVYVALHAGTRVLLHRPDLVVSGMNHGPNLSVDVFYSGTIAAAREAAMRGIPAIAVSADAGADPAAAAKLGAALAMALLRVGAQEPAPPPSGTGLPQAPLLNVNIPRGSGWEVRATRLGARLYTEDVVFRKDPRGREYMWIGGSGFKHDLVAGSDTEAFDAGVASVTPLTLDLYSPPWMPLATVVAAGAAG